MLLHEVDQVLTGSGNTAADDIDLRIRHHGDGCEGTAEVVHAGVDGLHRERIAGLRTVADITGAQRITEITHRGGFVARREIPLRLTDDTGRAGHLLETAMATAVAGLLLTVTHLDMADLCAGAMNACDDLTVDDESATDTGAEGHHHEIIVALTATLPHLAQGGNIGIVSDGTADLSAHELLHLLRRPVIMPAEVDADVHIAVRLDRTRHTDTDALDVRELDALLLEALLQCIRDIREDILSGLFLTGRHLPLIHQNTGECEDTALHRRSAYINTYTILIHMSPLLLQLY